MLLKALYDFAVSHKLLDDLAFKKDTPVRFIISLDSEGRCLGVTDTAVPPDRKKGALFSTPKSSRPNNSGLVSDFLIDEISAVFELNTAPEKTQNARETVKLAGKHGDFWQQVHQAATRPELALLLEPVLKFYASFQQHPFTLWTAPFLSGLPWLSLKDKPTRDGKGKLAWEVSCFSNTTVDLGTDLFTFEVNGVRLLDDDRIRAYWLEAYQAESAASEEASERGVCLVTGEENVPLARTHTPMVTGFPPPAHTAGAGFVSGEGPAFRSYGLDRALNAPTSIIASKAYLRALKHMVGQEDHSYKLGPATLIWWTDRTAFPLRSRLRPNAMEVAAFMKSAWSGQERESRQLEKFTSVTLAAAGPRLVVKDWIQITVGEAEENFGQWFKDLEIDPIDYGPSSQVARPSGRTRRSATTEAPNEYLPYSIFNLANTTIRPNAEGRYETEDLKPGFLSALYSAALQGRDKPLPLSLLKPLLERFRARIVKDSSIALREQSRFALIKLILIRNPASQNAMTLTPKLAETSDAAYNCGRLLSLFNALQRKAHSSGESGGKLNTTLAERYFASASSSPNAAFGIMWRLHQAHLKKLRQGGEPGERAAAGFRNAIMDICSRFVGLAGQPPSFPRVFRLEEQGRFALGFYQQEAARATSIKLWKEAQAKKGNVLETDDDIPADVELAVIEVPATAS